MYSLHHIKLKPLIYSLLITLGVGALSGFLTRQSMQQYQSLNKPPLSPPSYLFPIVWTILYILMAVSAFLIYESDRSCRKPALIVYGIQLAVNFIWPIIFFNLNAYLFAFIWLILLWVLVLAMILLFYRCSHCAAYLQIPYLLWITFAAYLNYPVWILQPR